MGLTARLGPDTAELVAFNQRNRDDWVAEVAGRLEPGTKLLDVGLWALAPPLPGH